MLWCQGAQNIKTFNHKLKSAQKCTVWSQCMPVSDGRTDGRTDRQTDEDHDNSATIRSMNASRAKSTIKLWSTCLLNLTIVIHNTNVLQELLLGHSSTSACLMLLYLRVLSRWVADCQLFTQYMMKQLHWLPVQQRIIYKLCLFMHQIHNGQALQYLSDCVSTVSAASHRYQLRSSGSAVYVLPRTRTRFGERGFFYSGPAAWNTLTSDLHHITDTSTFRKRLKSVLFDRAYHWLLLALLDVSYSGVLQTPCWLIDWLIDLT